MLQDFLSSSRTEKRSVSLFLLLFISVCAAFLGYGLASVVFSADSAFTLSAVDPYAGCHLAFEYMQRTAVLCRPFLLTAVLLMLFAYTKFAKTLYALFFAFYAFILGVSFFVVSRANIEALSYIPAVYTLIMAVYLAFVCTVHTKNSVRPLSESIVFACVASGAAGIVFTSASFIFRQIAIL